MKKRSAMKRLISQREKNGVVLVCNCGKKYKRLRWELGKQKTRQTFCSVVCKSAVIGKMIAERFTATFEGRFWDRVNKNGSVFKLALGPCWEWNGARNKDRYGIVKHGNIATLAHRIAFVLVSKKDIPKSLCVLHKCDNRCCVRFDHLFLGTRQDNSFDAMLKGKYQKQRPIPGRHPNSKLSIKQIEAIRRLYSDGMTQEKIAKKFKLRQSYISKVVRKEVWAWIR